MIDYLIRRAKRTPYDVLPGYMERNWLVPYANPKAGNGCGPVNWRRPIAKLLQRRDVAVRLNHILRSDHGRDPHSHPWKWYLTIILRGGYWEYRYDERGMCVSEKWHGPGSILFRRGAALHVLKMPKATLTLFITGPYVGTWGFMTANGMVPHRDYTGSN